MSKILKRARRAAFLARNVARHPRIAALGAREYTDSTGRTYDGDPDSPRSRAYDSGRELAHIATARRYDLEV